MRLLRRLGGLIVIAGVLAAPAMTPIAGARDTPYWPSERKVRLSHLDQKMIRVQRQLFRATRKHQKKKARRLAKRLKRVQRERIEILRSDGRLR